MMARRYLQLRIRLTFWAQAIKRDGNFQSFDEMRRYPVVKDYYQAELKANLRDAPLLSVVLSLMAPDSSPKSLLEAGHSLILISSILTGLMIFFAFGAAGYWLEGSVASAGGGLSLAYLQRSGAGRIDTDQLNLEHLPDDRVGNLGNRVKSYRASLVLAALAGAVFWVFDWWYSKPCFFGWAFLLVLSG